MDNDEKIARRTSVFSGFTLSPQSQLGTCIHSRWDFNADAPFSPNLSRSTAIPARVADDSPFTMASRTCCADLKKSLGSNNLASTLTRYADLRFSSRTQA